MDAKAAANAYRQSAIENAPPVKIVRLLYEGAIRDLDRALAEGVGKPKGAFTSCLARVDAIVTELRLALDHSHDASVSRDLERLYLFVEEQIARATSERRTEPVENARRILATLLEAWTKVEVSSPEPGEQPSDG